MSANKYFFKKGKENKQQKFTNKSIRQFEDNNNSLRGSKASSIVIKTKKYDTILTNFDRVLIQLYNCLTEKSNRQRKRRR